MTLTDVSDVAPSKAVSRYMPGRAACHALHPETQFPSNAYVASQSFGHEERDHFLPLRTRSAPFQSSISWMFQLRAVPTWRMRTVRYAPAGTPARASQNTPGVRSWA